MKYYIDCEFDGHNGPLLSMAMIREDGLSFYAITTNVAKNPWVIENVVPKLPAFPHNIFSSQYSIGPALQRAIEGDDTPVIIADSPVDIGRFCAAISTAEDGGYAPCITPRWDFEVHDVDCYPTDMPGAVQHNAAWDAMVLREKLSA